MISSEIQHLLCGAVQCICVALTWMGFDWIEWRSRFCTPHLHYTVHCAILTVHCAPTKLCTMQYRVDCAIHCNTVYLSHCALWKTAINCNTLYTLYTYHTVHCAIQTILLFAIHSTVITLCTVPYNLDWTYLCFSLQDTVSTIQTGSCSTFSGFSHCLKRLHSCSRSWIFRGVDDHNIDDLDD